MYVYCIDLFFYSQQIADLVPPIEDFQPTILSMHASIGQTVISYSITNNNKQQQQTYEAPFKSSATTTMATTMGDTTTTTMTTTTQQQQQPQQQQKQPTNQPTNQPSIHCRKFDFNSLVGIRRRYVQKFSILFDDFPHL